MLLRARHRTIGSCPDALVIRRPSGAVARMLELTGVDELLAER